MATHMSPRCCDSTMSEFIARKKSEQAKNSTLTSGSTSRPRSSSFSHPPIAATSWLRSAASVSATCAAAQAGSSHGRHLCDGMAAAAAAKIKGTTTRAIAMSLLERAEPRRVDGGELAADVLDDDAHDEDGDDQVEQDADLDEERHRLDEREAHDEDAVFQRQVADHLRDGLAARGEEQKAGEGRGQRGGDEQRPDVLGRQRQGAREDQRQPRAQAAEQERGNEADHRLDLAVEGGVAHGAREHRGDDDALEGEGAERDGGGLPGDLAVHREHQERQQRSLRRGAADERAQAAGAEEEEVHQQEHDEERIDDGLHVHLASRTIPNAERRQAAISRLGTCTSRSRAITDSTTPMATATARRPARSATHASHGLPCGTGSAIPTTTAASTKSLSEAP